MLLRDLKWGVAWGAFVGLIYTAMAGGIIALRGGMPDDSPPVMLILSLYVVAGVLGGAILGIARPWVTTRRRAMMLGPLIVAPVCCGFIMLGYGTPLQWDGPGWFAAVAGSIILGLMGGHVGWQTSRPLGSNTAKRDRTTD